MSNGYELVIILPCSASIGSDGRVDQIRKGGFPMLESLKTPPSFIPEVCVCGDVPGPYDAIADSLTRIFSNGSMDTDGATVLISASPDQPPFVYRFDSSRHLRMSKDFPDLSVDLDRAKRSASVSMLSASAARGDLDGAEKVIDGLSKQNDDLRKENAELAEKLASAATAAPGISRAIDNIHLEQEVDELRDVIKGYKRTIEDMDRKNKHTEGKVSAMESFIDRLLDRDK